ncbi:cation transporter [Georgenia sp. TF02-10]|uniref:heavy-metal-associated domain-containing protein n=1 Tax=Georgenia sp. TF02-10 TaxID=2917725 RepID=UPI001FA80EC0|nr:cation transporter [Georgenia sp. TF02-10]UNX54738.1 cation transporter [Georgenia sp. TF02-10]
MSTTDTARTTVLDVEGMTCGHCVQHVTTELTALPDVQDVAVDLHAGGRSQVTVHSAVALDDDALRAAVDEAGGYTVADIRRD